MKLAKSTMIMRYIKFILAALLSLLNVWLCSRTLDSNFNPMAFLGLIIYSFNACDLIYMLSKLCLETAITFAIFYGFFRNKVRNKKLYLFEIISCCIFAIVSQFKLPVYDLYEENMHLICGYGGASKVFIPCLFMQLMNIVAISVVLFVNKRDESLKSNDIS